MEQVLTVLTLQIAYKMIKSNNIDFIYVSNADIVLINANESAVLGNVYLENTGVDINYYLPVKGTLGYKLEKLCFCI